MRNDSTRRAFAFVALMLCAAALWFWWQGNETGEGQTVAVEPGGADEQPVAKPVAGTSAEQTPAERGDAGAAQGFGRTQLGDTQTMRITGRCVDAEGRPIGDCEVVVIIPQPPAPAGKAKNNAAQSGTAGKRVKPESTPKREPTRTGADGRFELTLSPVPVLGVYLRFNALGRASYSGQVRDLVQEEVRDLGDIRMLAGAHVSGRVLDTRGRPVENCRCFFRMDPKRFSEIKLFDSLFRPVTGMGTVTNVSGGFEVPLNLVAGAWLIQLDRERISPKGLSIRKGSSDVFVEIQVPSLEDTESIEGRIVDEKGQPIPYVRIDYSPRSRPQDGFGHMRISSHKDGSFRIFRRAGDSNKPVRLRLEKRGFDLLEPKQPYEWGTSGHRLVMSRGKELVLRAIDAATHEPIERYGVRIMSTGKQGWKFFERHIRQRGLHKQGNLHIKDLMSGRYRIQVVPDGTHLASGWREVQLPVAKGEPVVYELNQAVQQELLVISTGGQPIVGTEIELLEAEHGLPIDALTFVNREKVLTPDPNQATLWTRGRTNEAGKLMLTGPPNRNLGLRLLGPGHIPLYRNGILLVEGGPALRIEVEAGASVVGRVHPMSVIRAFEALGASVAKNFPDSQGIRIKTGLRMRCLSTPGSVLPGRDRPLPIAEDGSFRFTGLSTGDWSLQLVWTQSSSPGYTTHIVDLRRLLRIQENETRKADIDVSQFLLGKVHGTVLWNGKPLANQSVLLQARKESLPGGLTSYLLVNVTLDARGTFENQLFPAIYDCSIEPEESGKSTPYSRPFVLESALRVSPGSEQRVRLEFKTTELALRVKNHDGKPIVGQPLSLLPVGKTKRIVLPPTDAEGRISKRVPSGSFRVLIRPKHLTTAEGHARFRKLHPQDFMAAYLKALVTIGTLQLAPGDQPELREVTVPSSAGY